MIDFQVLGGFGNRQTDVQTFVLLESLSRLKMKYFVFNLRIWVHFTGKCLH